MNQARTEMTYVLTEADCRNGSDGYHLDVWIGICETFNLDYRQVDEIEIKLGCWEPKVEVTRLTTTNRSCPEPSGQGLKTSGLL